MEIAFSGGHQFAKKLSDGRFYDDSEIAYIAQGALERYIDVHSDLNEYIHSVIFESPLIKNSADAFEYESQVQNVTSLQADLDAKNAVVDELERATTVGRKEEIKKRGRQARAEVEDLNKRIADAELRLTVDKRQVSKTKQEAAIAMKAERDILVSVRELLHEAIRAVDSDLGKAAATVTRLNEVVRQLKLGEPVAVPSYPDRARLDSLLETTEHRVREVVTNIEKKEVEIRNLATGMREHAQLLAKRQEADIRHKQLESEWKQLEADEAVLKDERKKRSELFSRLLIAVVAQRHQYIRVIQSFAESKDKILSDLDFIAALRFDVEALVSVVEDFVDKRQVQVALGEKTPSVLSKLVEVMTKVGGGDETQIDAAVSEVEGLADSLRSRMKKAGSVSAIGLYQALYRSYLSVRPTALYKKTPLDRLSMGQKATVLIKIYLAEGDKPIIIDSHDDHLDNEFIMDELVGSIRQARTLRQVIIASNNGNVVVNSDADQVIVAQRVDGKVSYISGSIEEPAIREHALRVLEGGAEAFRRRQEKYRIPRL